MRSVSEQGGEEGYVYSSVIFCLIWVRSVSREVKRGMFFKCDILFNLGEE